MYDWSPWRLDNNPGENINKNNHRSYNRGVESIVSLFPFVFFIKNVAHFKLRFYAIILKCLHTFNKKLNYKLCQKKFQGSEIPSPHTLWLYVGFK